ncbi:MAG: hypothetical protein SGI90_07890 [Candidatus Eisenbacteria bacterium]|nr:hypothetical protein [Candidatus Eisenbacteria bacterium]
MSTVEPRIQGEAIHYRLFEVGYEIQLDHAAELLASNAPERLRPLRGEAQAIQIANPPVTVLLGNETIVVDGRPRPAELSARLFDFGVVSLRVRITAPAGTTWEEFAGFGEALPPAEADALFESWRDRLLARIHAAITRPSRSTITEEYTIFRVNRLEDAAGNPFQPDKLDEHDLARLLLGERRPLCPTARKELISPRLSYFADDLTVLTWSAGLVVEPAIENTDVQYVLEFANAQLLELRHYDHLLDQELPRIYGDVVGARRAFKMLGRRFGRLLGNIQTRVADVTESVERVENSLKVTDDVFLARVYTTALDIFRGPIWRRGIDRKMGLVRDTYTMLNAESQALRTEIMELTIIGLIALEIVLALWRD